MKRIKLMIASVSMLALVACGTSNAGLASALLNAATGNSAASAAGSAASAGANAVGSMIQTATTGSNLTNLLTSIIGLDKVTKQGLIGTWNYKAPGVAFTSESTFAEAGGEVVAATCKEKLTSTYSKVGFKSGNTSFTFNEDGTFAAKILGKSWNGTYTFDEKTQAITLKGLFFSLSGFTKRNSDGIALLFESKKILTVIQALGAMSGNSTLNTISEVAGNYNGVRVGFDLTK